MPEPTLPTSIPHFLLNMRRNMQPAAEGIWTNENSPRWRPTSSLSFSVSSENYHQAIRDICTSECLVVRPTAKRLRATTFPIAYVSYGKMTHLPRGPMDQRRSHDGY